MANEEARLARIERALSALYDLHVCDKVKSDGDMCPVCAMKDLLRPA